MDELVPGPGVAKGYLYNWNLKRNMEVERWIIQFRARGGDPRCHLGRTLEGRWDWAFANPYLLCSAYGLIARLCCSIYAANEQDTTQNGATSSLLLCNCCT